MAFEGSAISIRSNGEGRFTRRRRRPTPPASGTLEKAFSYCQLLAQWPMRQRFDRPPFPTTSRSDKVHGKGCDQGSRQKGPYRKLKIDVPYAQPLSNPAGCLGTASPRTDCVASAAPARTGLSGEASQRLVGAVRSEHWVPPGLPGPENPQLEKEAETAIGHIGTNAVPIYLRMIRSGESPLARVLMGHVPCVWLYRLGLGPRNSGLLGAMGLGLLGGGRKARRSSSNCAAAR